MDKAQQFPGHGQTLRGDTVQVKMTETSELTPEISETENKFENGGNGLHVACAYGKPDIVKILLDSDQNPNSINDEGYSPLHEAVRYNHVNVAKMLLEAGAKVNLVNKDGITALHRACLESQQNMSDIVLLLLNHGADTNIVCDNNKSPLHTACLSESDDILQILLEKNANIDEQNKSGQTALHIICMNCKSQQFHNSTTKCFDVLLKFGAETSIQDTSGQTVLHIACIRGLKCMAMRMIKNTNSNLDIQDNKGNTCLQLCCIRNLHIFKSSGADDSDNGAKDVNQEILKSLLGNGANPNMKNMEGNTVLHTACSQNCKSVVVDLLLQYGSDVTSENLKGQTPLHSACVHNADVKILGPLIVCGAELEKPDKEGNYPIHICCKYGYSKQLEELLNHGAKINSVTKLGKTPIHVACQQGHRELVKLLLVKGCDLSVTDNRGRTALHQLCESGLYLDLIKALLDNDPSVVKAVDRDGRSALHIACQAKLFNDSAVALLVQATHKAGCDINILDSSKRTAFASMINSCYSLLPYAINNTELMDTKVKSLDMLSDAGGMVDDVSSSLMLMTSQFAQLNEFLIRATSGLTTSLGLPVLEHLHRNNSNDTMNLMFDCGYRLDTQALEKLQAGSINYPIFTGPSQLMTQCRNVIRHCLRQRRGSMRQGAEKHPLPPRLINYINFK